MCCACRNLQRDGQGLSFPGRDDCSRTEPQHGSTADRALSVQEDIEDVSRTARQVKNRLERLDKVNEQALSRKVCLA